ncbi:MAG: tetratricopeptide repeat protein [Proteobacteria bacterium]|nr:tetratricopeptide repeat protein [Pseudomonadota bacterium]MBU4415249.1 tetratricopeptide repeat protein [Pseudomonadota bacterium]
MLILILSTLIVYWQVKDFDFVGYDDELYLTENHQVQAGLTFESFIWAFTTFHTGNWHPLTWLSHMLDCELYGLNPMGHHWTNLQLHIANTLLLFLIFQKMTGALWKSAFVAALFALHPLHVESVAWVAERKDVLSTFLGMLTIWAYISYVKKRNILRYLLVFILLSMGLMAKPMLVTFPFVLLLLDFWPLGRLGNISRLIWEKIPLFVPVAASSVLTFIAQQKVGAVYTFEALSIKTRIANACVSYANYMVKAIWPQKLAIFYPHPFGMLSLWHTFWSVLLIAGLSFLAIRMLNQYKYVAVGWFWYLGTLVPVIGLLQVGAQGMADRYTYIPLIGLFIIATWGISDLLKKWHYSKIILAVFAIILISAFSTRTYFQIKHWKNSAAVFENATKVTNYNWLAYNNLGLALMRNGKAEKAVFYYKKALEIKPDYLIALDNLGIALFQLGKLEEALSYYSEALKIDPEHAGIHNHIANVLAAQGKLEKAVNHYTKALTIDPDLAITHNNLAIALVAQGNLEKAIFHYELAIKKDPEYADAHYNLGCLLLNQKKNREAVAHFAEVIKINSEYAQAYHQIGLILVQQGKLKEASKFIIKAIQINPNYSEAIEHLQLINKSLNIEAQPSDIER